MKLLPDLPKPSIVSESFTEQRVSDPFQILFKCFNINLVFFKKIFAGHFRTVFVRSLRLLFYKKSLELNSTVPR